MTDSGPGYAGTDPTDTPTQRDTIRIGAEDLQATLTQADDDPDSSYDPPYEMEVENSSRHLELYIDGLILDPHKLGDVEIDDLRKNIELHIYEEHRETISAVDRERDALFRYVPLLLKKAISALRKKIGEDSA